MTVRGWLQKAWAVGPCRGWLRATVMIVGLVCAASTTGCMSARTKSYEYLQTTRHPLPVRAAATVGEIAGFIAGVPLTVLLLPVTVPAVLLSDFEDPYRVVGYPSVALSEIGAAALGGPVDLLFGEDDADGKAEAEHPDRGPGPSPRKPDQRRRGRGPQERPPPADR